MPSSDLLGIVLALTSAVVWGGGDFSGGFATRRMHQYQVLALSALSGIAILAIFAVLRGEGLPSLNGALWAGLTGMVGSLGLAALYRALSMGQAASVAPTAAVIGAILPVAFSILTEGLPGAGRLAGFGLAVTGIWLVSQGAVQAGAANRQSFWLACVAGLGFGGFFIFIAQTENEKVFTSLIVARSVTFLIAILLLRLKRLPMIGPAASPIGTLAGLLDAGGNIFFLLAKHYTRLDVAAVLSSLYPASTVLLSYLLLKEKISRLQWLGVMLCLGAIALITA